VISVTEVGTDDAGKAWDRFVLAHPLASSYHLMAWRCVVEKACGHRTFYLMARDEYEEVRGVLPLVFLSSRFFGHFLVSMPFFNYGGVLADDSEAQGALVEAAIGVARGLNATCIELRQQELLDVNWPSKQHKVSMRLALPSDFETLWRDFPSKLRSQIRRAQKGELTVRIAAGEILDDFYLVFVRNMRDLGTPVYARRFFETILQTFPTETRVCVVYLRDRPVAAGFLCGFLNRLEIPWASSDRRYNRLAPNMLLYSSVLEFACREGFQQFDFGRSSLASGTYRFKEQWGARPVPLYWYYWSSNGRSMAEVSRENPMYSAAIKVWTRLPLTLTKVIGPVIVRHIP
jgi:serine/alanine adding enzyme